MRIFISINAIILILACLSRSQVNEFKTADIRRCHLALLGEVANGKNTDVIIPKNIFWGDTNKVHRMRFHIPKKFNEVGTKVFMLVSDMKNNGFSKLIIFMDQNQRFQITLDGKMMNLTEKDLRILMEPFAKEYEALQNSIEDR